MFLNINLNNINWDIASTISDSLLSILAIIISIVALVKTSRDNNKILEETSRAYISIYTETLNANRNHFYIVIRNFGNTNAVLKDLKIDEKTKKMIKLGEKDYFSSLIKAQLTPDQSITHVVSTLNKEYDYNHIWKFEIIYTSGQKKYSDIFEFNLSTTSVMPSISLSNNDFKKQFLELYQDEIRKNFNIHS